MSRYPVTGFRVPPELIKEFGEVAKLRDMTRQEALIEALKEWIDKR